MPIIDPRREADIAEHFVDRDPQFKGLFQKMWEFKMLRQEIRIDIDDETFGGRHQEI